MLDLNKLANSKLKGNFKGFTLIELLAVIVILAVVALVATPIIIASVSNAKKSAANTSALGYIDVVNKYIELNDVDSDNYPVNLKNYTHYDVSGTTQGITYLNDIIKVSGDKPIEGWVYIGKNQVEQYSINIDGYIVSKIQNEGDAEPITTVVKVSSEETIKPKGFSGVIKIVYLDPTDLEKTCTKSDVDVNVNDNGTPTGQKEGCMRWYVYKDTGNEYKMILDHNTTPIVGSIIDAMNERLEYDTSSWQINKDDPSKIKEASLITGDEIAVITGQETKWNSTSNIKVLLFTPEITYTSTLTSPYAWLYNNTNTCNKYTHFFAGVYYRGCTKEDNNSYDLLLKKGTSWESSSTSTITGYWINKSNESNESSPIVSDDESYVIIVEDYSNIWYVNNVGGMSESSNASTNRYGIRPVITIPKSLID